VDELGSRPSGAYLWFSSKERVDPAPARPLPAADRPGPDGVVDRQTGQRARRAVKQVRRGRRPAGEDARVEVACGGKPRRPHRILHRPLPGFQVQRQLPLQPAPERVRRRVHLLGRAHGQQAVAVDGLEPHA